MKKIVLGSTLLASLLCAEGYMGLERMEADYTFTLQSAGVKDKRSNRAEALKIKFGWDYSDWLRSQIYVMQERFRHDVHLGGDGERAHGLGTDLIATLKTPWPVTPFAQVGFGHTWVFHNNDGDASLAVDDMVVDGTDKQAGTGVLIDLARHLQLLLGVDWHQREWERYRVYTDDTHSDTVTVKTEDFSRRWYFGLHFRY